LLKYGGKGQIHGVSATIDITHFTSTIN
jgi:hypothetical protein